MLLLVLVWVKVGHIVLISLVGQDAWILELSCLLITESISDLGLFDEVLVVVESLVELQLLHVLAIFDFKIFWYC